MPWARCAAAAVLLLAGWYAVSLALLLRRARRDRSLVQLSRRTRVAILTLETRPFDLKAAHDANCAKYAAEHGCDYLSYDRWPSTLPIYWQKFEVLAHVLRSGSYDRVLWLDSDAGFLDLSVPPDVLWRDHARSVVATKDMFLRSEAGALALFPVLPINVGVLLAHASAAALFTEALCNYAKDDSCRDQQGQPALNGRYAVSRCYEQGRLNRMLLARRAEVQIVGPRLIHCSAWAPTFPTYIFHLYRSPEAAADLMRRL